MPAAEALTFGGVDLAGALATFELENASNVETKDLPGYSGVHVPYVHRGALKIHLAGKVLGQSFDDIRAQEDALNVAFGSNDPQLLYMATDRCVAAYVEHFDPGWKDSVVTSQDWAADLLAPFPLWTDPTLQLSSPVSPGVSTNPAVYTYGLEADCGAPSFPVSRILAAGPGTFTLECYGANLLRNTTWTDGQSATQDGVPLRWTADVTNYAATGAGYSYGVPSSPVSVGPSYPGQALGQMMLQQVASGGGTLQLYQRVTFLEEGQPVRAWLTWRGAATVTLQVNAYNTGGTLIGTASATLTGTEDLNFLTTGAFTTPSGTTQVEYRVIAVSSAPFCVLLEQVALLRGTEAFWPGHSTYASFVFSDDGATPAFPAGAMLLLDSQRRRYELLFPSTDQDTVFLSYVTQAGDYPIIMPFVVTPATYHFVATAAGASGATFDTRFYPNYWTP